MNLSGAEEITSCRLILRPDEKCSGLETFIWTILLKEGRKIIGHFKAQYEPEINKITYSLHWVKSGRIRNICRRRSKP